jgi:phosphoribosylformylglycinamidine synthase I
MSKPRVKILYAPGINCHHETADAFRRVGAEPMFSHLFDLIHGKERLGDCDLLSIPGGFAFGDHVGAGRVLAIDLIYRIQDQLQETLERKIPIIGLCNGFQVLVHTGLLPNGKATGIPRTLLDRNRSAVFESRMTTLFVQESPCLWTRGMAGRILRIPVGHGEGRLCVTDDFDDRQTVLRFGSAEGSEQYPDNPNGSPGGRAGICDPSGRIFGMMPHPERAIYPWLGSEDGLAIFQSGVDSVK